MSGRLARVAVIALLKSSSATQLVDSIWKKESSNAFGNSCRFGNKKPGAEGWVEEELDKAEEDTEHKKEDRLADQQL